MRKYLYGHTSQETAYVVGDYPWGFRLRTKIRYWIETSHASNGGQRFCHQTVNPKTGAWCAPKKSTYSSIEVMYLDENEHVQREAINLYCEDKTLWEFHDQHKGKLDDFQKDALRLLIAGARVMKHVKFEVKSVPFNRTDGERDAEEREQDEAKAKICRIINHEYHKIAL